MHIHFIYPRWKKLLEDFPELRETLSGREVGTFCMAGLGIPTAAAAIPPDHTVSMTDEHVEPVDYAVHADLIALSFFTPQASNAYAIADRFRAAGRTVVAGGIHPSMNPEETLLHADAVITGPSEGVWESLLEDFLHGRMQRLYRGTPNAPFAQPRRELFRASGYLRAGIVQTARGCDVRCPFCVVHEYNGPGIIRKPIPEVLDDLRRLPFPCFYFADENLLFSNPSDRAYRHDLFDAMKAENIRKAFFFAAYPFMLRGLLSEDIQRLAKAGCRQIYLVLGLFDPLCRELTNESLIESMRRLQDAGIETMASFTIGHEEDDPAQTDDLITAFASRSHLNLAEFIIWTPFPGTPVFQQLEKEGRILTRDWSLYNGAHPVFRPLRETPEALRRRFIHLWRVFYEKLDTFNVNQRYAKGFSTRIFNHE
ncbi:MAG: radical SAM protein [Kiritimatiellae bacterium]|nr:radical SAM protein [Kiritimatiellia bacterium]